MPDISNEITAFQNAVYGKDVRQAIVDLAEKLNDDLDDALTHELSTVDATLTQSGAGADAKVVGDKFAEVVNDIDEAWDAIPDVDDTLGTRGAAADAFVTGSRFSAHAQRLTALEGTTSTHTSQINTINTTLPNKADKSTVTAIQNTIPTLATKTETSALDGRLDTVETTLPTLATKAEANSLDGRLDAVEATLPTLATKEVTYPLIGRMTNVETSVGTLDYRLGNVEAAIPSSSPIATEDFVNSQIENKTSTDIDASLENHDDYKIPTVKAVDVYIRAKHFVSDTQGTTFGHFNVGTMGSRDTGIWYRNYTKLDRAVIGENTASTMDNLWTLLEAEFGSSGFFVRIGDAEVRLTRHSSSTGDAVWYSCNATGAQDQSPVDSTQPYVRFMCIDPDEVVDDRSFNLQTNADYTDETFDIVNNDGVIHATTDYVDDSISALKNGITLKDTVTGTEYKLTVANGQISLTAV